MLALEYAHSPWWSESLVSLEGGEESPPTRRGSEAVQASARVCSERAAAVQIDIQLQSGEPLASHKQGERRRENASLQIEHYSESNGGEGIYA